MNPKFSIIVPIFKSEPYLKKCIDSILNQTFDDFELILVNDGSPDACGIICDEYAEEDTRVKVIHKRNKGVSIARNVGIALSKGEYITFIDSDDLIDSVMLCEVNKVILKTKPDVVVTGLIFDYFKERNNVLRKVPASSHVQTKQEIGLQIIKLEENSLFGYSCSKFYKNNLINKYNFNFNSKATYMEDLLFNCDYFMVVKSIYTMENCFYHYMIRDSSSLSSKFTPELFNTVKEVRVQINKLFDNYQIKSDKYPSNLPNGYIIGIQSCIHNIYHKECTWTQKEKLEFVSEILNDENLLEEINYFEPTNLYSNLFVLLYKTNNKYLINAVYTFLFLIRNNFRFIYRVVRKRLLA